MCFRAFLPSNSQLLDLLRPLHSELSQKPFASRKFLINITRRTIHLHIGIVSGSILADYIEPFSPLKPYWLGLPSPWQLSLNEDSSCCVALLAYMLIFVMRLSAWALQCQNRIVRIKKSSKNNFSFELLRERVWIHFRHGQISQLISVIQGYSLMRQKQHCLCYHYWRYTHTLAQITSFLLRIKAGLVCIWHYMCQTSSKRSTPYGQLTPVLVIPVLALLQKLGQNHVRQI